jgi:glutathione S-transferase
MSIKQLKLYHYPATRSARVLWALHETVDDFEVETVELYQGVQYSEDYMDKNPNHNVPMLEITFEDGSCHQMLESVAMVEWLVDAFPDKGLAPSATQMSLARSDYLQMLHFGGTWMDMMLWQVRIHEHVLPSDEADPRTIRRYRKKFELEAEPQLKARLERTPFICGEAFSGADIVIGHNVTWARAYQLCQDDIFGDYISRLAQRPAFLNAFSDASKFELELPNKDDGPRLFTG